MEESNRKYEIFDPYVGKAYGNILDQYHSPTYVITLSVPPPVEDYYPSATDTPAAVNNPTDTTNGNSSRQDAPPQSQNTTNTSSTKRKVIIAQTGVTATQIDDLEINSLPQNNIDPIGQININFTITQPGAANLFDQIQYARKYMGYNDQQLSVGGVLLLQLEVEFKGYSANAEDEDLGGELASIAGPYSWLIIVQDVNVRIDQSGSYYDFTCVLSADQGFADQYFKIGKNITSRGKTITEHVTVFVDALNKYLRENQTSYTRPDEIEIDLSELIGRTGTVPGVGGAVSEITIKDETVVTSESDSAETSNKPMGDEVLAESAEQRQQLLDENPTDTGLVDRIAAGGRDNVDVSEGTTIYDYIGTLLSMNVEFKNKMSRKKDINDPSSDEVNLEQTFVSWFGMKSKMQYLAWDAARKDYTKKITFIPYMFNTARGDIVLTTNEYSHLEKRNDDGIRIATKRLQDIVDQGNLRKAYYYIFTGRNDQILNLDINMDHAKVLILPPRGGYTSDISITSAQRLTAQSPINKDMTLRDVFKQAKSLQDGNLFKKALSQLSQSASNLSEFAFGIGRSVDEIKAAISDSTGRAAQSLVSALDDATLAQAARSLDAATISRDSNDTPTQNSTIQSEGFGDYVPEVSGQIYASDFVTPNDSLKIEELESAGFIVDPEISGQTVPPTTTVDIPNKFNRATYDTNTPANMLFGFVYRQHTNISFMHEIDMTLRGDPWYLGADNSTGRADQFNRTNSTPSSVAYRANQNYFILQIGTTTAFDVRVDDEDANSGYWNNNISNSFSGVYVMLSVMNRFSRGIFTSQVKAVKEETVPLHLIRPLRPGETPPDFSDLDFSDSTAFGLGIGAGSTLGSTPGSGGEPFRPIYGSDPGAERPASSAARAALGLSDTPTPEELERLRQFTPVPRYDPNASLEENAVKLGIWANQNGLRADENVFLERAGIGEWNEDAHRGAGHAENRAFDLNIGRGNVESADPHLGMRMDYAARTLRAAGYNVIWRTAGHEGHLHFEIPRNNVIPDDDGG